MQNAQGKAKMCYQNVLCGCDEIDGTPDHLIQSTYTAALTLTHTIDVNPQNR